MREFVFDFCMGTLLFGVMSVIFYFGMICERRQAINISDKYFIITKVEQVEKAQSIYTIEHMGREFRLKSAHEYSIGDSLKITISDK